MITTESTTLNSQANLEMSRPLWQPTSHVKDLRGDSTGAYFLGRPNCTHLVTPNKRGDSTRHQSRLKNFPEQKLSGAKKKNRKETTPGVKTNYCWSSCTKIGWLGLNTSSFWFGRAHFHVFITVRFFGRFYTECFWMLGS